MCVINKQLFNTIHDKVALCSEIHMNDINTQGGQDGTVVRS
jgi:hypothetical protein